jgi:hypothetical protein
MGDRDLSPPSVVLRSLARAIRACDVRAADLQEEPTKRVERADSKDAMRFVGSDEDGGFLANIASERSELSGTASAASGAIKMANSGKIDR